jgi:DNA-binding LytR/AlgR family response regulator
MNCIIIDDEPLARDGMALLAKNLPQLTIIGSFSNGIDAASFLRNRKVDLIFLDINMPEINGLDFAKNLALGSMIIFTTAYPQYATESYDLEAIDYLLKPIRLERFIKAINKAEQYSQLLQTKENESSKVDSIQKDFVFIKSDRKFFKVYFDTITHIEGLKDYVILHLKDQKILTAMNLKTILEYLPAHCFMRISKSYIVNTSFIVSCDNFNVQLDNTELPIGASFKDSFFKNFIEGRIASRD